MSETAAAADGQSQTPATSSNQSADGIKKSAFIDATIAKGKRQAAEEKPAEEPSKDGADASKAEDHKTEPKGEADDQGTEDKKQADNADRDEGLTKAHHAEREARQKAQAEVEALKEQNSALEEQIKQINARFDEQERARRETVEQQQFQAQRPDRYEDPEGFNDAYMRALNISRGRHIEKHGADAVMAEHIFNAEAAEGRVSNEVLSRIVQSHEPFAEVWKWYQDRQSAAKMSTFQEQLSQYGGDFDALIEAKIQERMTASGGGSDMQDPKEPVTKGLPPLSPDMGKGPGAGGGQRKAQEKPQSDFMARTMANSGSR